MTAWTRTPIQPSQVTSRANSDLLTVRRLAEDFSLSPAQRMAAICAIADGFRFAVEGSTADPFNAGKGVNGDGVALAR